MLYMITEEELDQLERSNNDSHNPVIRIMLWLPFLCLTNEVSKHSNDINYQMDESKSNLGDLTVLIWKHFLTSPQEAYVTTGCPCHSSMLNFSRET